MSDSKYILVKGDISGIQEFIFNIKSDGAARSLKGRSFFIKVLTEITIAAIFDLFNIPNEERNICRISTSGGNFYLRVPHFDDYKSKLENLQLLISKGLRFTNINLILGAVDLIQSEYKICLDKLNAIIRLNKLNVYHLKDQHDFEDLFSPNDKIYYTKIEENSSGTSVWESITNLLRVTDYMTISKTDSDKIELKINQNSIELCGYRCYFHNDISDPMKIFLSNYLESVFPLNSYGLKQFKDLVYDDKGDKKMGILKMDVDNLGATVENVDAIDIHFEFDENLRKFFNDQLRIILQRSKFENKIYTVTAGGDDSFFVGHWKVILDLAIVIQKEFNENRYFKNFDLTISAGYIIIGEKFPVIRFGQLAEDALHKAKYKYDKGNICIFDEVVSWYELKNIIDFKNNLLKVVDKNSKGLLAKARQTAIRGIDDEIISMKENWEIAYYLRNSNDENIVSQIRGFNIESTHKTEIKSIRTQRLILPVAARLAELEMR